MFIYELSDPGFKSNCSHITQIVLRGIAVNAVVAHKEIITSVGSLQVSAGQEAENESIIYAIVYMCYDKMCTLRANTRHVNTKTHTKACHNF